MFKMLINFYFNHVEQLYNDILVKIIITGQTWVFTS